MFRTTYRQGRSRIHHAPVENREPQITIKANKKQTLFFRLIFATGLRQLCCRFLRHTSYTTYPDNLSGLNEFKLSEANRYERHEVFMECGSSAAAFL
jgi:hypothetical protein